jgi:hypothetical protein
VTYNFLRTAVLCTLSVLPTGVVAQQASDAHNIGIVLAGGLTALPDALSTQCGRFEGPSGGTGGPEGAAALLVHVRRWFVVQADTRVVYNLPLPGCPEIGVSVDTVFASRLRHEPLATSAVRAGLETPPGLPLFRVTAGLGVAWGVQPLPLAVMAIGWSTRGKGARFLIEGERAQTRVRGEEVYHMNRPQPDVTRPVVVYPAVQTLRMGVELPLRSDR